MNWPIDKSWTLFLDRDGVLNRRIVGDYVRKPQDFEWLPGVLPALRHLTPMFGRTLVVTNQQGVGKQLMTQEELDVIHSKMTQQAAQASVIFDNIYACTALASANSERRKPAIGMALDAQQDYPLLDFSKSIMVGDSPSDIEFGLNADMHTVFIAPKATSTKAEISFTNLWEFARYLGA